MEVKYNTDDSANTLRYYLFLLCVDLGKLQALLCKKGAVATAHFVLSDADIDMINRRKEFKQ